MFIHDTGSRECIGMLADVDRVDGGVDGGMLAVIHRVDGIDEEHFVSTAPPANGAAAEASPLCGAPAPQLLKQSLPAACTTRSTCCKP